MARPRYTRSNAEDVLRPCIRKRLEAMGKGDWKVYTLLVKTGTIPENKDHAVEIARRWAEPWRNKVSRVVQLGGLLDMAQALSVRPGELLDEILEEENYQAGKTPVLKDAEGPTKHEQHKNERMRKEELKRRVAAILDDLDTLTGLAVPQAKDVCYGILGNLGAAEANLRRLQWLSEWIKTETKNLSVEMVNRLQKNHDALTLSYQFYREESEANHERNTACQRT